jgi:hypothetical protein
MLTGALGAAAATVGAGTLLEGTTRPAAASTGNPLLMGQVNEEEASTEVRYDRASSLNGVLLLANDGTSAAATTAYKAALGGWAAGGAAHVATGVYGLSTVAGGNGVVGSSPSSIGVLGSSTSGNGIMGASKSGSGVRAASTTGAGLAATSASTAANASAVLGILTTTTAGTGAAAVRGQNDDTTANGIGVYGSQAGSGTGVFGNASSGTGVVGSGTVGVHGRGAIGVGGTSVSGYGVVAESQSGGGAFISSQTGIGVSAYSGANIAVSGTSNSTTANAMAILGTINSTSPGGLSAGVFGQNNGTGAGGVGVYGVQNGFGTGVYGTTPGGTGVYGYSASGAGVFGETDTGTAVLATSRGSYAVDALNVSTADDASAVLALMSSPTPGSSTSAVYAYNADTSASGIGVFGKQAGNGFGIWGEADGGAGGYGVYGKSTNGYGVLCAGGIYALFGTGNFAVTGTKSAVVPAENGLHRALYCMESPECWFEDFGGGALVGGSAQVQLDPTFAATVRTDQYYIFLVPEGDCNGLYVSAKSTTGFSVRELRGGTSSISFSYRVVALRKDVTAPRFAVVEPPALPAARPAPQPSTRPAPPAPTARPSDQGSVMPPTMALPAIPAVPPQGMVPPLPPVPPT